MAELTMFRSIRECLKNRKSVVVFRRAFDEKYAWTTADRVNDFTDVLFGAGYRLHRRLNPHPPLRKYVKSRLPYRKPVDLGGGSMYYPSGSRPDLGL